MALLKTPKVQLNAKACEFNLPGTDGRTYNLSDCMGSNGLVVMFICNHCPYVKAILSQLIEDVTAIKKMGVGVVAICSNDPNDYEEDRFENMKQLAEDKHFNFPYLQDLSQAVAKNYGAVCTPDFFGYDSEFKLQYRGRLDDGGAQPASKTAKRELLEAMKCIATTGKGPDIQIPSMGCSIKWRDGAY